MDDHESSAWIDLYWLPLGAGGHSVRLNGRVYERIAAALQQRTPRDLCHAALEVGTPQGCFVIERSGSGRRRRTSLEVVSIVPRSRHLAAAELLGGLQVLG
jgi:hypothetical protein